MATWLIEPRDPLIVRDGRPFGPNPGARAQSLPFPFPSTITGAVRSRDGEFHNNGVFPSKDKEAIERVLALGVRGPLLVSLDDNGEITDWLLPAPGDALPLPSKQDEMSIIMHQLVPLALEAGEQVELPIGLKPVGVAVYEPSKPAKSPPRYWSWRNSFQQWLVAPEKLKKPLSRTEIGHNGPVSETRMHVNIVPETQVAREGHLFMTSGLEFRRPFKKDVLQIPPAHRLGLAIETEAQIADGIAPLGGERRLMDWRKSKAVWPTLPLDILEKIVNDKGHCRLLLLTPAFFAQGWQPHWLLQPQYGVQPELMAAVIHRPQVVSGWDFAKNEAKPSRRLAPAGTVYFLQLKGRDDDIRTWVQKMWMHCVSDDAPPSQSANLAQNRLDGFGLAVLGTWSGKLQSLEVRDEKTKP